MNKWLPLVAISLLTFTGCIGGGASSSRHVAESSASSMSQIAISSVSSKSSQQAHSSQNVQSSSAQSSMANIGAALYQMHCANCHGPRGLGMGFSPTLVPSIEEGRFDHATITRMPPTDITKCDSDCAAQIKTWLTAELNIQPGQASSEAASSSSAISLPPAVERWVPVVSVNVGGLDAKGDHGHNFLADYGFTGGDTSNQEAVVGDVANTEEDILFKTERWGEFSYTFALPNDEYRIELGFTELVQTHSAGSRVFNVALEQNVVLSNIDIVGETGGFHKALVKELDNIQLSDGLLNIEFKKVTHNPTVSYIKVLRRENTADQYARMCQSCHGGPNGEGRSALGDALIAGRCDACTDQQSLAGYISVLMPFQFASACTGDCANNMAEYILTNFAGFNGNPPVTLPDFLDKAGDANQCGSPNVAESDLRRIGRFDYNRMVRDLFAVEGDFTQGFSADQLVGNFYINTSRPAEFSQVRQYFDAAEKVAEQALVTMAQWAPCQNPSDGNSCIEQIIQAVAVKAYRRPLSASEESTLLDIYRSAESRSGFERGLSVLVQAILTSPQFLYYIEQGVGSGDVVPLNSYEIAARLALFFWRSLPDETLLTLAKENALQSDEQIKAQAVRMLADPRARDVVALFHQEWMLISAPEPGKEGFEVQTALMGDFERTLDALVFDEHANFADLFTTDLGYFDEQSKAFYGITGNAQMMQADGFDRYIISDPSRQGILSRAPFLRSNHSATKRGLFLREQVLCGTIPTPPAGASDIEQAVIEGLNPRQLFNLHTQDPGCGGCHALMDPLGFPLDHFDEQGAWRDTYGGGFSVDASGAFIHTDVDGTFEGAQQLQNKLATSQQVQACYAYQWYQFGTGRFVKGQDSCSLWQVNDLATKAGGSIQDVMTAVVLSDGFRHRRNVQ